MIRHEQEQAPKPTTEPKKATNICNDEKVQISKNVIYSRFRF